MQLQQNGEFRLASYISLLLSNQRFHRKVSLSLSVVRYLFVFIQIFDSFMQKHGEGGGKSGFGIITVHKLMYIYCISYLNPLVTRRVSFTDHIPQVTGTGDSNCAPKRNMFLPKIYVRACLVLLALLRLFLGCFGANIE